MKRVPFHLRKRLKRKRKSTLENYSDLSKKSKNDDVTLIKQVPLHPDEQKKGEKNLIKKYVL